MRRMNIFAGRNRSLGLAGGGFWLVYHFKKGSSFELGLHITLFNHSFLHSDNTVKFEVKACAYEDPIAKFMSLLLPSHNWSSRKKSFSPNS
jgi:hypothetical protein